ncbi:hypothetical protein N0O92_23170 [Alkalihalobacillus sp. MEB130]|nr:hypothetical protein [Alkalihalobacillus sp. MEB130]MDT8863057.1 hypothetical protein [Alkalihalobacillus sp. MEB130]
MKCLLGVSHVGLRRKTARLTVNVKLTMYIFDHLRMYKINHHLFLSGL